MPSLIPQLPRRTRRRGAVSIETLLSLALMLAVVLGIIGVADLIITEQVLAEASARGARSAALGGTQDQIESAVRRVLGPVRAEGVQIFVGPVAGAPSPDQPVPPGGLIEVRVEVGARQATMTPFAPVGAQEKLVARSVMQRE
ncbi:TadE/TadG family type IV pilus assembly protein [Fimbriiglobus ruber]|uniref:TadE/TadG family type IV pilus assembly protein n=1 Tax=Fimbriiglobus ruber TaxID=1908690 RepID=UPI00137A6ED5|nr:TadE/TadG family type IV pilus assembly protein [Fimbriiglobus ruber]